MMFLRSREIITSQSPLKTLTKQVVEPSTPSKTHEPSTHQFSPAMSSSPPSHSPDPNPNLIGSGPYPVSLTGTIRRRSLRLASKSTPNDGTGKGSVLVSGDRQKRKSLSGGKDNKAESEKVRVCDSSGNEVRVSEVKEGIGDEKIGFSEFGSVVDRVTELGETELGFGEEEEKKGVGEKSVKEDIVITRKGRGKRKLNTDTSLFAMELGDGDEDEGDKGCFSLRSGKRVVKRSIDNGVKSDGFESIGGSEKRGKDKGGERILSDEGKRDEDVAVNELEKDPSSKRNVGIKTRRLSIEEKGKGKLVNDGLSLNGIDLVEMDLKLKAKNSIYIKTASENGAVKGRSRFRREEKGKGKLVEDDNDKVVLDLESKVKNKANSVVLNAIHSPENVALQDEKQNTKTNMRVNESKVGYMDRFRDIAKRSASRFAHFTSQEEEEDNSSLDAEGEMPSLEKVEEVEDWPGPFSTAMKIIKERTMKLNVQQENISSTKIKPAEVLWVPKKSQDCDCPKPLVPSLLKLCMTILTNNADAITSLENVPDVIRHKLSQLLCDSRRMNGHFFDLLVCGFPTDVRIKDCSWLTEEQFTKSLERCDTSNLTVLRLDQCGRCMPDYILRATLARSLNSLPALTTISLRGACRLSDIGLSALVSSAPALKSINLGQCSLLTSIGIDALADSLGSVLRELYIDDCQNINAMLVLPALKKLEHLEVLSLAGVQTVCDDFVRELMIVCGHNMKELDLTDCVKLTDSSLKVIAKTCSGLSALALVNLCKLTDSALGYLANGCGAIETLKLCRNAFSDEAIAAFLETSGESLKELSLNNVKKVGHNTAISLARHSRKLLSLDLSWCRELTDEALGLIVDSCSLLRVLKLFGCTQITNVFLDGHSNPKVQIIGLKLTPILEHFEAPDPQEGPLHYSSVPSM